MNSMVQFAIGAILGGGLGFFLGVFFCKEPEDKQKGK